MQDLELGLIGNGTINALVDRAGTIVWCCWPRPDGDPVLCRLIDDGGERGLLGVALEGQTASRQAYLGDSAVLVTTLADGAGDALEVVDLMPRFEEGGAVCRPPTLLRLLRPLRGAVRVRISARPCLDYGAEAPAPQRGGGCLRYVGSSATLRLSTDAPLDHVAAGTPFTLDGPCALVLGADAPLGRAPAALGADWLARTLGWWRGWVDGLSLPVEWQADVIRSAITLKLCVYEETGAAVAAVTTSLPEADGEGRNWDYRLCWVRDTFFIMGALRRVGDRVVTANYRRWLDGIIATAPDGFLQPLFGLAGEMRLVEREVTTLRGYRGNQPIRVGNQAYEHHQHDGYGSVILALAPLLLDRRARPALDAAAFARLEPLGEHAWKVWDKPDAGLWEFRALAFVHTHSAAMCWAALDRLAMLAAHLGLDERARLWAGRAATIRTTTLERAWNAQKGCLVASFGGDDLDASLLLLHPIGFIAADDPRWVATVTAVERELAEGPFVFRYKMTDDFGAPAHAFLICSFWLVEALASIGRSERARALFEQILRHRNRLGLFAEHVDRRSGELWGNFPQAYSHCGLITGALRLSRSWDAIG